MQGESYKKNELDDDILQCKAQLQKVIRAVRPIRPEAVSQEPQTTDGTARPLPLQTGNAVESQHLENHQHRQQPERQSVQPGESSPASSSNQTMGVRILPFEAIHKNQDNTHAPDHNGDGNQPPSQSPVESAQQLQTALEESLNRLNERIQEVDDLQKKNKQLLQSLDESVQAAADKQRRIEDLERQLAEKINELSALQFRVEEYAAVLAQQAQQLRRSDQEKGDIAKRLEEQALEWARTIDALKAAQEAAARTLTERQQEVETLRTELSNAQSQSAQANADNARLTQENAELRDALEDAHRRIASQQAAMSHEQSELMDEPEPEPYCEPYEDVISEDDVHLEQHLASETDPGIPAFNLAEQILAEQRKAAAARRRQPRPCGKTPQNDAIEHVMEQYFPNPQPEKAVSFSTGLNRSVHIDRLPGGQGEYLTPYQRALLSSIVEKNIRRFCGRDISSRFARLPISN